MKSNKPDKGCIVLGKEEYALFLSEVNRLYFSKYQGRHYGHIVINAYGYHFRINDFNEYVILDRWRVL